MDAPTDDALARRRERVAGLLRRDGADALVATTPAAIAYLTGVDVRGFSTGRSAAVLRPDGAVVLAASDADRIGIDASEYAGPVAYGRAGGGGTPVDDALAGALGARGSLFRIAVERPGSLARGEAMPGIDRSTTDVVDAGPLLADAMRLKDDGEIALLRDAANLADVAYTAAVDRIHPELRAYEIVRNVDRSVRGAGGGGWWSPAESELDLTGMAAFPHAAVAGLLDRQPETGVLDADAPLPFHLHPLARCYTGATGTTVIFRRPDPGLRSAAQRLADGVEAAIGASAPGAHGAEVLHRFSRAADTSSGDGELSLIGYSVGTGPGPVVVSTRHSDVLEPCMVFCLRATARVGPARTAVVYQTTVLVTGSGAERLDVVTPLRLVDLH